MNLFVIGDVHGCFNTFKKLLRYWNSDSEILVQIGDLVDRGNFTPETVDYAFHLSKHQPENTVFLKGNHELQLLKFIAKEKTNWLKQGGMSSMQQYKHKEDLLAAHADWLYNRPLFWENKDVFISHAGISLQTEDPFDVNNQFGVLWNRSAIRNLGRVQIFGHTPGFKFSPYFDSESLYWNIDTGAYLGRTLSGIKLSSKGELLEIHSVKTLKDDID